VVVAVVKNPEFEAKHHRGTHGRFGPGMSKPKLLKRDERAVAAIGDTFHAHPILSREHAAEYTRGQRQRIRPETVTAFHELAGKLRRRDASDERVKRLDAAMAPLEHDLVVTRHVPAAAFGLGDGDLRRLPELLAGRKIVDRAYTPTALHQDDRPGGVTLHIAAPAGTRALVAGDNEVWLDRDLELAVGGVYPNGRGGYAVELTVLPKGTATPAKRATKAAKATKTAAGAATTPAKKAVAATSAASTRKATKAAAPAKEVAAKKATKKAAAVPPDQHFPSRSGPLLGDLMDRKAKGEDVDHAIRAAVEGEFGGLTVKVKDIEATAHGGLVIGGTIHTPGDDPDEGSGMFERLFYRDEAGKLVASHEYLQLDRNVQGSGFAREFNNNLFDWYRRSGFDRVEVNANIDVGGYTWATQGFDFQDADALQAWFDRATDKLDFLGGGGTPAKGISLAQAFPDLSEEEIGQEVKALRDLFQEMENGRPTSAYEISQVGRRPGMGRHDMWIGKLIMLESHWMGVLRL
jgi:hypothetical protein